MQIWKIKNDSFEHTCPCKHCTLKQIVLKIENFFVLDIYKFLIEQ